MTRYLCGHPGHQTAEATEPVDVTPQVRLERLFAPRALACLAFTDDVLDRVLALPEAEPAERTRAVLRLLTGDPSPHDGPVVLVESSRVNRAPGLYQIDDLRTAEPAVGELLARFADPSPISGRGGDEVVVLGEADAYGTIGFSGERIGVEAPAEQRTRTLPQGVFSVIELAQRLAAARSDEDSLVEAVRRTASYVAPLEPRTAPWRVIVECPVPVDAGTHDVLFTGTGEPEPPIAYGTLPNARDEMLERDAATDLDPARETLRAERRLKVVLIVVAIATIALALAGWLAGGLAFMVREAPFWLGAGGVLVAASVALAVYGLLTPVLVRGNLDDLYDIRAIYQRRLHLLWWTATSSGSVFLLALVVILLPGLIVASSYPPIPAPRVSFAVNGDTTVAHIAFTAHDVGRRDHLVMDVRSFRSTTDLSGVTLGRLTTTGSPSGEARVNDALAINGDARFMAVRVWFAGRHVPICTPRAALGTGCTLVTVPQRGVAAVSASLAASAQVTTVVPGASTAPITGASPSPSPSPSASPFAAPSFSP